MDETLTQDQIKDEIKKEIKKVAVKTEIFRLIREKKEQKKTNDVEKKRNLILILDAIKTEIKRQEDALKAWENDRKITDLNTRLMAVETTKPTPPPEKPAETSEYIDAPPLLDNFRATSLQSNWASSKGISIAKAVYQTTKIGTMESNFAMQNGYSYEDMIRIIYNLELQGIRTPLRTLLNNGNATLANAKNGSLPNATNPKYASMLLGLTMR